MDEVRRHDSAGLHELGLAMIRRQSLPEPESLKDVLETWPSEFAVRMMHLSMRPMANFGFLLGLSWAFVRLHQVLISSPLLGEREQKTLQLLVQREIDCLKVCYTELQGDSLLCADFHRGHEVGKAEVATCLSRDDLLKDGPPPGYTA